VTAAALILVQTPKVQTAILDKVTEKYLGDYDADISVGKISLRPFHTLVIKDLAIVDKNPQYPSEVAMEKMGVEEYTPKDTLVCAEYIVATFTLDGLMQMRKGEGIHLKRVLVRNGRFNLVVEEPRTNNLKRMFNIQSKKDKKKSDKTLFVIDKVVVKNFGYGMQIVRDKQPTKPKEGSMNWADLDVYDVNAEASNIKFSKGIMTGTVETCNGKERGSGYIINDVSAAVAVGNGQAVVQDIHLQDPWSEVSVPHFIMSFSSKLDFRDYIHKVGMDFNFSETRVNTTTLKHFASFLGKMDLDIIMNGNVYGPVTDLQCRGFNFRTADESFSIDLNGEVAGLPKIDSLELDLTLDNCKTTVNGIEKLIRGATGNKNFKIGYTLPSTYATIFGRVKGGLNDLATALYLGTGIGDVLADMRLTDAVNKNSPMVVDGELVTEDLDLGKILGKDILGECSVHSGICATIDKENGTSLRIDSLMVDKVNIKGYDYHKIAATGTLSQKMFEGRIISQDPACNFLFQGVFTLAPKTRNAIYQFYANVGHADLHAMNIDKRESSNLSFRMNANFNQTSGGQVLGNINVANLVLESDHEKHDIGDINISSNTLNNNYRMNLSSKFAEANYNGSKPVSDFIGDLLSVTVKREVPALFKNPKSSWNGDKYDLSLKLGNTTAITAFLKPGLYIDNNTQFSMNLSENGDLKGQLKSHRIALKEQYLKDIDLSFDNLEDVLQGKLGCEEISLGSLLLQNDKIDLYANDNEIGVALSYENDGNLVNKGEFVARGNVFRNKADDLGVDINVLPSGICFNSSEWSIMPAEINLLGKSIKVRNALFTNGDQAIHIDGGITKEATDTLTIALDRFDLGIANTFTKKAYDIQGALTGEALITSDHEKKKGIIADFLIDSTSVAGTKLGSIVARSQWNSIFNRFDIKMNNTVDEKQTISVDANLYPSTKRLEAIADLSDFEVGFAQPFISSVFSEIGGSISGRIRAEGPLDQLEISSMATRFNNALLRVDYTNVPYYVDGPFHIDSYGVYFDDIPMRDTRKGTGVLSGKISYDHFKDISLGVHIDANNIEAINMLEKRDAGYYGQLYGTGTVDITGQLGNVLVDVKMATTDAGDFHVPMSSSSKAGTTDLLKFKEPEVVVEIDPYEEMMAKLRKSESSKKSNTLEVRIDVRVNPLVDAFIEINKDNGNMITGTGNGDVLVDVKTGKGLSLKGDYVLNQGNLHLNLMSLASRDFTINEGSTIKFNGAVMDSDLDIDAIYKTKASISALIGDTTSVNSRRNVECGLKVGGKLKEPKVSFSINIPDLDPSTKSRVENALSTEDKVQKQVVALLVTNSFIQDEQSGIYNNTTSSAIYSNATNILTNQVNSILNKLNIPVDLGLNYQQNDRGNDVFDVAVSTQLFNNRVVINGNIGNRQYKNGNNNSEVAGDIDIEVKLDRSGSLRLNLFSHSADQYTNYLDNSQRNGLGIAYQKEFNKVGEVFKYMFAGKAKKERLDAEEMERLQEEGMKTIEIE